MNPLFERAILLSHQGRADDAERSLRQALASDPNDANCHGLLGILLVEQQRYAEAMREVEWAIRLAPHHPFSHYAHSIVLLERNCDAEAEQAIRESLRLDSENTGAVAQLAKVLFSQRRWQEALEVTEQGLRLDPENAACTNLRAMCLVQLGRKTQAGESIASALQRDPENDLTHANMGWTFLEQGKPEQALHHFGEALRLNPNSDWARAGLIEAMKARFFFYRLMLRYFLGMMKLTRQAQWGILIGGYLGYRMLISLEKGRPEWSWFLTPLLVAYMVFALSTWLASPLFNLLLRLNRFGRLALSREETITSNWVGLCVLGALFFLAAALGAGFTEAYLGALACAFMVPPVAHYYHCQPGTPRQLMIGVIAVMGTVGFFASVPVMLRDVIPRPLFLLLALPTLASLMTFQFVALGSQFAVNYLVQMRPRR